MPFVIEQESALNMYTASSSLGTVLLIDKGNGKLAFQFAFDKNELGADILDRFINAVISSGATKKGGKN